MPPSPERHYVDIARRWLSELQACVRAQDFDAARSLFAEDVIGFGTYAAIISGREALEREQWRNVWPHIREFTFRLDEVRCIGGESGLCVIVPWGSLGLRHDGTTFARPGRATLVLAARGDRWVAVHSHFSLQPRSIGT